MPAVPRRSISSSLPTLLSLTKLLHHIPRQPVKRSAEWAAYAAMAAAEEPAAPEDPPGSPNFWWKLSSSMVLVSSGGVFAGSTLASMGSDDLNSRVLSTSSDDEKERKAAAKVLRLSGRGRHWVLVVLLLGNVIVNESLPIFLDDVLGGGVAAVIVSTTMIVIFGEIIPQAVCVRYGLSIGGACAPSVLASMILFAPIAWPIAKLLDYVLGTEGGNTYKKAELKSFSQFHREGEEPLRDDEIGILNGVSSLNDKHAQEIMTPIKDCLTLSADKISDHEAIDQISLSGFSRIPIYEPGQKDNFIGMSLVKKLITYNPEDAWPVSKFPSLPLPEARPDINCFQALDYFQTGRAHLLLISNTPGRKGGALGIVSLEDSIEEIIGEEIVDETDRYQDNRSHKVAKRSGTAAVMRGIIERQRVIGAFSRRPSARQDTGNSTTATPAKGDSNEGLLIQINDGNSVAEPVSVPEDLDDLSPNDSRRVVVAPPSNHMEPIDEVPDSGESTPLIASHGEEGVQNAGVEAEVGGAIEGDKNGKQTLKGPKKRKGKKGGKKGDGEDDGFGPTGRSAFPKYDDFARAAHAFIEKYQKAEGEHHEGGREGDGMGIGAERHNRGWEWREAKHKWTQGQGYLYRKVTRYVQLDVESDEATEAEQMVENDEDDEMLEHEDESTRSISSRGGESRASKSAGQFAQMDHDEDGTPSRKIEKVSVEHHIVYSKTYHVPQSLIRAWDEHGAPVTLPKSLKYRVIHSGAHLADTSHSAEETDSLLLDPHSPFPLLQHIEHPVTGDIAWSVHPCQVAVAVEEVLTAESEEQERAADANGSRGQGEEDATGAAARQLRWLECWMMLSSGVVDLSA